ncbi:MAG: beta-ketoacyl-ACP synthase II [Firmicutes bacterium]|nr:beta-ketoacyl-ACP synthase II [Bacillota bacterium]
MGKRVVVTGLGLLTPVGNDIEHFWENIVAGRSSIGPITKFDTTGLPTTIGGEVRDFDPLRYMDKKTAKHNDLFILYAIAATMDAVRDAGLDLQKEDRRRIGLYLGTGFGGVHTFEEQHTLFLEKDVGRLTPYLAPMIIANMASGQTSILLDIQGPNSAEVAACATSAICIGDGAKWIQEGEADVMLCGGSEASMTRFAFGAFSKLHALSTNNDDPQRASRPFDKNRDGFVMSEGAAVLVLEELDHALARGAHIYCELIGYGLTGDAYHMVEPNPSGEPAANAMRMAMRRAGVRPEEIDYINAHGTSTYLNDLSETRSIKLALGDAAYHVAISSTKAVTGHLLGAAGSVEAAVCALAIHHQIAPPTAHLETPDPECDLDYIPNQPREMPIRVALSNSFGFGGHNTCLAFSAFMS